jgi:predicted regulator of amino acid metabolism with ACT domain
MDISSGDISAIVFRRVVREDTAEYSFDAQMLMLFMELDGKKSLAVISKKTGLKMSSLREAASKLLKVKLIEQVAEAIAAVDADFMDTLKRELSLAIGPLAQILIEDAVSDLGQNLNRFPIRRAPELVETLSREIQREDKRAVFKQAMVRKIKEKGY